MPWFLILCCCLPLSGGQEDDIKVDYVETVHLVNLPVRVARGGVFIKGLKKNDFLVTEDGRQVEIHRLATIRRQVNLHFLFDLSASNWDNLERSRADAREVVNAMRGTDRAKVAFFSHEYQSLGPYTGNRKALLKQIGDLKAHGSTALYDGIARSLMELSEEPEPRSLLVFSDGYDLLSKTSRLELTEMARSYHTPIFLVAYKKNINEPPLLAAQTRFLKRLGEISGGGYYEAWDLREVKHRIKDLRQWYQLSFIPKEVDANRLLRALKLKVPDCQDCLFRYDTIYRLKR